MSAIRNVAGGFNIAGYVVPGILITLVGTVMIVILRRRAVKMAALAVAGGTASVSGAGAGDGVRDAPAASQSELERLERELRELDQ